MVEKINVRIKAAMNFQEIEYSAEVIWNNDNQSFDEFWDELVYISDDLNTLASNKIKELDNSVGYNHEKAQITAKNGSNFDVNNNLNKSFNKTNKTQKYVKSDGYAINNPDGPASEKQLTLLRKMGYNGDYNLTKREASELIDSFTR